MYEVTVKQHFSGAHFLRGYKGKCENIHGHNWQVEVTLGGENLDENDLLFDFVVMKAGLNEILERLDHKLLNELPEFMEQNPSSEIIAKLVYDKMRDIIKAKTIKILKVRVGESEDSWAVYYP